ncbi:MAG: biotin-dependent carboxyltransferase family protein [Rhodocyclales bacterium]|nr:biotin-dependent carboxyltransferase family protein [Rhodocyclales bacterium]
MIEVLAAALPASIQDFGRPGYRHLGMPLSGALDPEWMRIANALAGNSASAAVLEMRLVGPRLRVHQPLAIGLGGEFSATIEGRDGTRRPAANWCGHQLAPGEILELGNLRSGIGYLAASGGFRVPPVLGSRSTYVRAGIGGLAGRCLVVGDRLDVGPDLPASVQRLGQAPRLDTGPIRVIAGPQAEYFTAAAWSDFLGAEFTVTREADRMGLRLDGSRLEHEPALGTDIVSDAVTPGAIQVPGDGKPIILLADCQTVGGYPKIATVIGADLRRLGHALPGQKIRFAAIGLDDALAARRAAATALEHCLAAMLPAAREFNLDALYGANLIDGVIDAGHAD